MKDSPKSGLDYIAQYNREKTSSVNVRLFPADDDIARHLDSIREPKATYIKRLIREDMDRTRKD